MRGLFALCAVLAAFPAARSGLAGEPATEGAAPGFRLLELGGRTVRWQMPERGLPATITYAYLTEATDFPGARNCDAMLPPEAALSGSRIDATAFRREVEAAFSLWQRVANVTFREVSAHADAGILIGADAKARGRAFTNVALHENATVARGDGGMSAIRQSLICLNPKQPWKIGFDGDLGVYDLRFTMAHEIGHAIGLDHPGAEGQLMSYRYVEKGRELTAGDIAGALALYGRKGATAPPRAAAVRPVPDASPSQALQGKSALGLGDVAGSNPASR